MISIDKDCLSNSINPKINIFLKFTEVKAGESQVYWKSSFFQ